MEASSTDKTEFELRPNENFIPSAVYDRFVRGTRERPTNLEHQEALEVFKDKLKPRINIIYYPGCGLDDTPSVVFPKSKVIYVDRDDRTIKALHSQGYEAYQANANQYNPGVVDMVILSGFYFERPLNYVSPGGFVISDDFWRTADKIVETGSFELIGVLRKEGIPWKYVLDTENPRRYLEEVETDEELRERTCAVSTLEEIEKAIKRSGKTGGGILETYREILKKGKKAENGYSVCDKTGKLLFPLPRKLDKLFFVFKRKPSTLS